MDLYRYHMPVEVVFGAGVLSDLGKRCRQLGNKPLVVTGKHSARAGGLLDRVCSQFPEAAVFDKIEENPTTVTCGTGAAFSRNAGCDFVVGIGGGSPMDVAKAIAVLARNPLSWADCFSRDTFEGGVLPIVAVPTTAGTGSEVTPYAVLVDPEPGIKRTMRGPDLFPRLALLDPELTVSLPPAITAATGLDALSQAMEGVLSKKATPISDALAFEVCRLIKRWLPRAVSQPGDLEARAQMLHAAMLSGVVIAQTGTTLVHAMGYYFTLNCGLAHGLANALLLAPVFRWDAAYEPARVAALAGALDFASPPVTEAAGAAITRAIHTLLSEVGISPAAREYGVSSESFGAWAEHLRQDTGRFKNQVGRFSVEDLAGLFEAAWRGD